MEIRPYKLMVTKHVNYEQIVKAWSKEEALGLYSEEDLYETDSRIASDIKIEEYFYEEHH